MRKTTACICYAANTIKRRDRHSQWHKKMPIDCSSIGPGRIACSENKQLTVYVGQVVWASTASILVVVVSLVVNIITEQVSNSGRACSCRRNERLTQRRRHGQVPPWLLRKGRHAILPQDTTEVLEADHQRESWPAARSRAQVSGGCWTRALTTKQLDKLWSLVPTESREKYIAGEKKDTVPVLDLLPLGYSKVLGKGRIPEIPLVVRARWVSRLAEKKITEAGGVVELVA
jgi:ribosomal protein L15